MAVIAALAHVPPAPHLWGMTDSTDLTGKLLIAMPDMGDPRFDHAVIYMCSHSSEGAMGLIVNKPTPEVRLADLLEQLSIDDAELVTDVRVHYGGPVETGPGLAHLLENGRGQWRAYPDHGMDGTGRHYHQRFPVAGTPLAAVSGL